MTSPFHKMDQIPYSHAWSDMEEEREEGAIAPWCQLGQPMLAWAAVAEGPLCRRNEWAGE